MPHSIFEHYIEKRFQVNFRRIRVPAHLVCHAPKQPQSRLALSIFQRARLSSKSSRKKYSPFQLASTMIKSTRYLKRSSAHSLQVRPSLCVEGMACDSLDSILSRVTAVTPLFTAAKKKRPSPEKLRPHGLDPYLCANRAGNGTSR